MKTLQQCNWKAFRVEDIFEVKRGNAKDVTTRSMQGDIALVTAIDSNNAVSGMTTPFKGEIVFQPSITVHNNGNGVGLVFVHHYPFVATSDVSVLTLKNGIFNNYALKFFVPIIQQHRSKFDYGYKLANNRLKAQTIMLPCTDDGTPDYEFMESYMREKERLLLQKYKSYISLKINDLGGGITLNSKQWKAFELTDIFTIKATSSGIDRNKLTGESGDYPYITRTDSFNGWDSFIAQQPNYKKDRGNVISIGLDTQTAFYQPIEFYTGQNIQVFSNPQMTKYIAAFMLPLLKIQLAKFNWGGNGATLGRLKRLHIMLPTNENRQPDYMFMNNYMLNKELQLLQQYAIIKLQSLA